MLSPSRAALIVLVAFAAACAPDVSVGASRVAIIGGVPEPDLDAVVAVRNVAEDELCSGTLVSPRVVVTAKHCVQGAEALDIAIGVGPSVVESTEVVFAQEVRTTEGVSTHGRDVAVVILRREVMPTPIRYAREVDRALVGQTVRVVGFGIRDGGEVGVRYAVDDVVTELVSTELATRGPSGCQGDSGGPALDAEGTLVGIASRGLECAGRVVFGLAASWLEMIDGAVRDSGGCVPSDETCNSIDDDCDGEIDEICDPLGTPCEDGARCLGGLCAETPSGRVCSAPCDPALPAVGCGEGLYCAESGCTGLCAPGAAGSLHAGEMCDRDVDCVSLRCRASSPSELPKCVDLCIWGTGGCVFGEACDASREPGACGNCVDADRVPGPRQIGEVCGGDGDCADAICLDRLCARTCSDDGECPLGFTCRETERGSLCIPRAPEEVGSVCRVDADCAAGLCGHLEGVGFCTQVCDESAPCPAGLRCDPAEMGQRACVPERAVLGEACGRNEECSSGVCAVSGGGGTCTRACGPDRPCPAGLLCARARDGTPVCLPLSASDAGCGCLLGTRTRVGGLTGIFVLACALLFAAARRRRR